MLQRNSKLLLVILFLLSFVFVPKTHAQMMGNFTPSITPSVQDLKDIQVGQDLYSKFQSKQTSCKELKDGDFEKIGEYLMNQSFGGNSNAHIQMNNNMKQMMGENGEEQMHIRLGKNATGCNVNVQGGVNNMMGWGYSGMMSAGFGFLETIVWIVVLIDLVLLGIWFWKKIQK